MTIAPNLPLPLLGDITPNDFIRDYWQQKPLLIRQAIPHFKSPIDGNDLAGLALEEVVESRLIIENGKHPWEMRQGPFNDEVFAKLPKSHWTLLVQSLDVWIPEIAQLKEKFRFLPDWRIEDIMVSYAPKHGGVGPHFDQYDVFLLQGSGQRRWKVGNLCTGKETRVPQTPLNILHNPEPIFEQGDEWVLEPGDMLYIPPQVAHWGEAESDDCITYSVGFRAPSQREILSGCSEAVSQGLKDSIRFKEALCEHRQNAGEILADDIEQLKTLLKNAVETICQDEKGLANWFGREMTYPRVEETLFEASPVEEPMSPNKKPIFQAQEFAELDQDGLNAYLKETRLERSANARFAYFAGTHSATNRPRSSQSNEILPENEAQESKIAQFFVNGEQTQCSIHLAQLLCDQWRFEPGDLCMEPAEPSIKAITLDKSTLLRLLSQGWLEEPE